MFVPRRCDGGAAIHRRQRSLKGAVDSRSFRKGTWGAEIVDSPAPQPQDIVVEGKRGLRGFASANLDFILRGPPLAA
jgi:nicotinamidase-related amidase